MTEISFDMPRAHRWFAVEFNNRAWDLVEKAERTDAEIAEMLHTAHAALVHWRAAGTVVNELRAHCLLATAYAAANVADGAMRYSENCLELLRRSSEEATPFDRACAYGCAAQAYAGAGNRDLAREYQARAAVVSETLSADDREVIERLYPAR